MCQHLRVVGRFVNLVLRPPSCVYSCASDRYLTPILQPKFQTTVVNYTALYGHSLLPLYSA